MTRFIIIGAGGSGKDFLKKRLVKNPPFLKQEISYTTRPPREGEKDGVDYHFITDKEFDKMVENDKMYQWTTFNEYKWKYGTTKNEFHTKDLFIMNVSGVRKIDEHSRKNCFIIYLDIPEEIRKERLMKRKDNADSVERRLATDREDFKDLVEGVDFDIRIQSPNF